MCICQFGRILSQHMTLLKQNVTFFSLTLFLSYTVRYNALGQIICQICGTALKNEMLWNPHLQSRKHKEVNTLNFVLLDKTCFQISKIR